MDKARPLYRWGNEGLSIEVTDLSIEYAGCGSHHMDITFGIDLDELNQFLKSLGIEPLEADDDLGPAYRKAEQE